MTEFAADQPQRRRGGERHKGRAGLTKIQQLPRSHPKRPFAPMTLLSADELESIHQTSLTVLEEVGMDFNLGEARDALKRAGAEVDGERVRIPRALVEACLKTVPGSFVLHARNSDNSILLGGDAMVFGNVSSPPNCSDIDGGRRAGSLADFRNLIKLSQVFNCIHFLGGYPVEPIDVHASVRHLVALKDMATLTDKPFHAYALGRERITDGIEIARIVRGISHAQLEQEASLFSIINTNSPLKLDMPMLHGIMELSSRNQAVCVTPFTLAGAMAPVTIAGALVEQNAEALAGLVMTQVVRPGAPFIYGGFTSNVDMKSGAPAFGTPEYMKAVVIGGQLARRYGVPYRSSNTCAANAVDAQAAYESVFSLWGVTMGGGNMVMHAAGWMEGGLVASFEKFVLDCDLIQMVMEFLRPLEVSEDTLGLDAIREVGPGGHFFGAAHTLSRYSSAFYAPLISDWRNYQQWDASGRPEAWQRANVLWKQALAEYEPPAIDPAIAEELDDFVARRIEAGGAPTDF